MEGQELNMDGVYLDPDRLIKKYRGKAHSISDTEEIQQISLFCQQNRGDYRVKVLLDLINPMFSFAGLYPHIIDYRNIGEVQYDQEVAERVTKEGREILQELLKKGKQ